MDSALKKFGIYDFLGIYFAGVVIMAHVTVSFPELLKCITSMFDINFIITENVSNNTLKFIFVFVIIGYFVGAVFHELGRIIFDRTSFYRGNVVKRNIEIYFCKYQRDRHSKKMFEKEYVKCATVLQHCLKHKLKQKFNCKIKLIDFETALSYIKFKDKRGSQRIDKYHAIYGFSRSMFLYFALHPLLYGVYCLLNGYMDYHIAFLISDFALASIFFFRTKRYFISFVKNVYLQYYIR